MKKYNAHNNIATEIKDRIMGYINCGMIKDQYSLHEIIEGVEKEALVELENQRVYSETFNNKVPS